MRTWLKRLRIIGTLLLLGFGGMLFLKSQFARRQGCELVRKQLPRLIGAEVTFERCEIDLLAQTASLRNVSVKQVEPDQPIFSADSVRVRINALRPFFGSTKLDFLTVERPRLFLDFRSREGVPPRSAAALGRCPAGALRRLQIGSLELNDGEVQVLWNGGRQIRMDGLGLRWESERGPAEFRLSSSGGLANFGEGREARISELDARGRADLRHQKFEFQRAVLSLDDAHAVLNGTVEEFCDPALSLQGQISSPMKLA